MPTITSDALDALCRKEDIFYKNIHYEKKLTKLLTLIKEEFDSQKYVFICSLFYFYFYSLLAYLILYVSSFPIPMISFIYVYKCMPQYPLYLLGKNMN